MQCGISDVNPVKDLRLVQFGCLDEAGGEIGIRLEQFLDPRAVVIKDGFK